MMACRTTRRLRSVAFGWGKEQKEVDLESAVLLAGTVSITGRGNSSYCPYELT